MSISAVVVLGGHRCGTSCVAGAIDRLGIPAALPGAAIGASPSNPRGHFEDAVLVRLHERLLRPGGWRDPLFPASVPAPLMARYDAHLRRRAASAQRWCIKDPRLCVLLPLLTGRLAARGMTYGVVTVTRSLEAAAESLQRRQRISLDAARRIAWLYEGARRAQLAGLGPAVRVLAVGYEQLLADRSAGASTLAEFLEVPVSEAAVQFLDPAMRHCAG